MSDRTSNPPCKKHCKYNVFMRNAAKRRFWDHTMWGGGGGGSEPRTGIIYTHVCKWGLLYSTWLQIHPSLKSFVLTQIDPIFLYFSLLSVKDFTHGPIDVSFESFQSCQKEIHNKSWRSTVKGRDDSFPIWVEHQGFPNVITKPQKWRGCFQK